MNKSIEKKIKNIKILLSDIDGVLTDGGMYYSSKGEEMKKFNTKDGMGVELLKNIGIKTILITKENSKISKMRAKKINVKIFSGIEHKERMLDKICQQHSINYQNVCYIGDDVNDLEIMKKVGFSATPKDGVKEVKRKSTFISTKLGGEGVLREVADLIIRVKR